MSEIKSLADQLRSKMAKPDTPENDRPEPGKKKTVKQTAIPAIVQQMRNYDIEGHKSLVHARFDSATSQLLSHFKRATGIEVTRLVAFAVTQLIEQHPEIKSIVKQYIQDLKI